MRIRDRGDMRGSGEKRENKDKIKCMGKPENEQEMQSEKIKIISWPRIL